MAALDVFQSIVSLVGLAGGIASAGVQRRVGEQEKEAFFEESRAVQLEGAFAREEAEEEAERVAEEDAKARARQSLAFLKSGVSLVGSPLIVQAEARAESERFIGSILRRGKRQETLAFAKADILRSRGRARLLTRTAEGITTGLNSLTSFSKIGGFTGQLFGGSRPEKTPITDSVIGER